MANRNYATPRVDPEWASSRETHMAVATAIHAIASKHRSPEAIWESPTPAEDDNVKMALVEYLDHGDFEPSSDGVYHWGLEVIAVKYTLHWTCDQATIHMGDFLTRDEAEAEILTAKATLIDQCGTDEERAKIEEGKFDVSVEAT